MNDLLLNMLRERLECHENLLATFHDGDARMTWNIIRDDVLPYLRGDSPEVEDLRRRCYAIKAQRDAIIERLRRQRKYVLRAEVAVIDMDDEKEFLEQHPDAVPMEDFLDSVGELG
jgi:hypothetical protein